MRNGVRHILEAAYATRPRKPAKAGDRVPRPPTAAELAYLRAMRSLVKAISKAVKPEIAALAEAVNSRADAADGDPPALLKRLRHKVRQVIAAHLEAGIVDTVAQTVNAHNLREMQRVLGIDRRALLPNADMDAWTRENVDLITSVGDEYLDQVETMVTRALDTGTRHEALARDLQDRLGVAESRANLIARDQVLKANARLSHERMRRVGVTRYVWRSTPDSRTRPDHAALDDHTFRFEDPPIVDRKSGRRENPGGDFQCLPGHERIRIAHGVRGAFRRAVSGQELVVMITERGRCLEVTPNHPVLTGSGWKPAHSLDVGDEVFGICDDRGFRVNEHIEDGPPSIEEVFDALALVGASHRVTGSASQFHGDGADGEIEVVRIDGVLRAECDPALAQHLGEQMLAYADSAALGLRDCNAVGVAFGLPTDGIMGRARKALALLLRGLRHPNQHRIGTTPDGYVSTLQMARDCLAGNTVTSGERFDADALDVEAHRLLARVVLCVVGWSVESPGVTDGRELDADRLLVHADDLGNLTVDHSTFAERDRVVDLARRYGWSGHVFNLETVGGWYASNVIIHNCRCQAEPVFDDE